MVLLTIFDDNPVLGRDEILRGTMSAEEAPLVQWARREAENLWGLASGKEFREIAMSTPEEVRRHATSALEFLRQYSGDNSEFYKSASAAFVDASNLSGQGALEAVASCLNDWASYTESDAGTSLPYEARSRQDAATDLMEQVQSLLGDTKVHPAAPVVLAGAALEEFLRSLVSANSCPGPEKPAINTLATALKTAGVISTQDIKDITSWAGQRNQAAHGHFEELSRARAQIMVDGINLFMRKYAP